MLPWQLFNAPRQTKMRRAFIKFHVLNKLVELSEFEKGTEESLEQKLKF